MLKKRKPERKITGEQTRERRQKEVWCGICDGDEKGGVRFIKSLRRPNKPVGLFALRDARGDRLLCWEKWDGQESLACWWL